MQPETVEISSLRPPDRNVRIHTEAQIKELARAVTMFGQTRPVVVDEEGVVLAGNGLIEALMHLGRHTVAVHRVTGLSEIDKQKLMLSDNRIFELGHDDHDAIIELIRSVGDVDIPGFDSESLATAMTSVTVPDMSLPAPGRQARGQQRGGRQQGAANGSAEEEQHPLTCPHCGHEFTR